ncbi:MAG TPA: zinc transporter ZntB, partial [Phycisphaerales bacterium]|nr:zinc transporter ZntB [Phycisphaerales bacterium]
DAALTLSSSKQLTESKAARAEVQVTRDQLARIVEELAAIESRAAVTRDEIVSQRADQLNQRVYVLTVLAGVCLPLSVLTGMLGMNVGGIPLAASTSGFLITTLSMLTLSAVTLGVLRMIKWI